MNERATGKVWSVILAADQERGVQDLVERWLGAAKPKTYCTFMGTRSLFQHTVDRADLLTPPERRVTVVPRSHRGQAWGQFGRRPSGKVLEQPEDRGTAAGFFLGLTYVRALDPDAIVVFYPADHFVYPEDRLLFSVWRAVWAAEKLSDSMVLLGAPAESLELDYNWIVPGRELLRYAGEPVLATRTFVQRPEPAEAQSILAEGGALWNTFMLVTKVRAAWKLGWRCFPETMPLFDSVGEVLGTSEEWEALDTAFRVMQRHDLAADLLQWVPDRLAVLPVRGVLWSDWSRPERIAATMARLGKKPAFPEELLVREPAARAV